MQPEYFFCLRLSFVTSVSSFVFFVNPFDCAVRGVHEGHEGRHKGYQYFYLSGLQILVTTFFPKFPV